MDPMTMMALADAAKGVGEGVGNWMEADRMFTNANGARLGQLQKQQAAGQLGMNSSEQELFARRMMNPLQAAEAQRASQSQQMIANQMDTNFGAAMQASMTDANLDQARAQTGEAMAQQALADKKANEKELYALESSKEQMKKAKQSAIIGAIFGAATDTAAGIGAAKEEAEEETIQDRIDKAVLQGQVNFARTGNFAQNQWLTEKE